MVCSTYEFNLLTMVPITMPAAVAAMATPVPNQHLALCASVTDLVHFPSALHRDAIEGLPVIYCTFPMARQMVKEPSVDTNS